MSYPTLALASDPNNFSSTAHDSLINPPYNGGPYAASCTTDCDGNVPSMFWRLGQRRECCTGQKCATKCSAPTFPGNLLTNQPRPNIVDNLTGYYCNYSRDARYVGTFGGVQPNNTF
jgi:hypothetical protein